MLKTNAQPNELPALLTSEDLAAALRVSIVHVRRLCASGNLPAVRRGRRWYLPRDRFLAEFSLRDDDGGSARGSR